MDQLILPLLLALLFVPLFLSFRKQRRAQTEMMQLQSSLGVGDRVMTTSGMYATIVTVDEDTIDLEIAPGLVTTWVRQAIRERVVDTADDTDDRDDADDTESANGEAVDHEAEKR
jgi:preprotein translocase subunit YajC